MIVVNTGNFGGGRSVETAFDFQHVWGEGGGTVVGRESVSRDFGSKFAADISFKRFFAEICPKFMPASFIYGRTAQGHICRGVSLDEMQVFVFGGIPSAFS